METTNNTATEIKLAEMLVENTGRHILDSGDAYGRNWQRNQGLDVEAFKSRPRATWTRDWATTVDVFHYLNDLCTYSRLAELLDKSYRAYSMASSDYHLEDIENWSTLLGGKLGRGDNSYNLDCSPLSQVIQWQEVTFDTAELLARIGDPLTEAEIEELAELAYKLGDTFTVTLLQIHGGADIRGGYTRPVVFEATEYLGYTDYTLECAKCETGWTITSGGEVTSHEHGGVENFDEAEGCPNCKGDLTAYAEHDAGW